MSTERHPPSSQAGRSGSPDGSKEVSEKAAHSEMEVSPGAPSPPDLIVSSLCSDCPITMASRVRGWGALIPRVKGFCRALHQGSSWSSYFLRSFRVQNLSDNVYLRNNGEMSCSSCFRLLVTLYLFCLSGDVSEVPDT